MSLDLAEFRRIIKNTIQGAGFSHGRMDYILKDMRRDGEIRADGKLVYRRGRFLI